MGLPSEHSPLGASGAYRWLTAAWGGGCYASAALSAGVTEDEEDDTYSRPGSAAHALGEACLRDGTDAFLRIGKKLKGFEDIAVDKEMADAVQVRLNTIRGNHPERHQGNYWIERPFHCPSIHQLCYGRSDDTFYDEAGRTLYVYDYKHGAGIVVEAERNPQMMYYACGMLEDLDLWEKVDRIVMTIIQPRGFHWDGPVRSWEITTPELEDWLEDVLIPGMNNALVSRETRSGDHCRFCPARLRDCSQLRADRNMIWGILRKWLNLGENDPLPPLNEMETTLKNLFKQPAADKLKNGDLALALNLFDLVPIMKKAYERTAFNRMTQGGVEVADRKVVHKRQNRDWKKGAEVAAKKEFGEDAYTTPEFKSPAQFDTMPKGKAFSARWAFKPEGELTVVHVSDNRRAVEPNDKSKLFKPVKEKANG
jgi:hypothetical protein